MTDCNSVGLDTALVQRLLRSVMDAVYHDFQSSFAARQTISANTTALADWFGGFIKDVHDDMLDGKLDPFKTNPYQWLRDKGYTATAEVSDGL